MNFDYINEIITPENTVSGLTMITIGGTQGVEIPEGNTAARPSSGQSAGTLRFNTDTPSLEWWNGTSWITSGTVTSVALAAPSIFTVSGSPVTTSGTLTLALANESAGTVFAGPATGSATTPTFRALVSTDISTIAVTSAIAGTGISVSSATGNVTFTNTGVTSLSFGSTGLTPATGTTGAITVAGTLNVANGGTGTGTAPTAGQILVGTSAGGYVPYTLASGTGISTTTGSGTLQINNTGVTSFQTNMSGLSPSVANTGAITLSGTLGVTSGGTGTGTAPAVGSILVGASTSAYAPLAIGTINQVLTTNGVTASWQSLPGAPYMSSSTSAPNTLVSGTTYSATVPTNLNNQNIVASIYNNSTLQLVTPHAVLDNSANSFTLEVTGNSNSYLCAAAVGTVEFTVTPTTLVSGTTYSSTITHNLGTNNYVACVYNNSTNALVIGASLQQTNTNTLVLSVTGNTTTYRVVLAVGTLHQVTPTTLVSGTTYSSTITHNLGTNNLVVCVWNNATGQFITPLSIQQTSVNALVLEVTGNTNTYNVIIVNGMVVGGSSSSSSGTTTAIRTFTFYASALDNPNSSDWAVNSLAPVIADPTYISMSVRQFSTSTEGGVGTFITVPSNSSNISISFKGRAQVAPASASTIVPYLYVRSVPNNAAVGAWSSNYTLSSQTVPTNANFQYYTQTTAPLGTYGMAAGGLYLLQFDISTTGTYTTSNWLMAELTIAFS